MEDQSTLLEQIVNSTADNRIRFVEKPELATAMREVCAMLNAEGGWIAIGVKQGGVLCGMSEAEASALFDDIRTTLKEDIYPSSLVFANMEEQDGLYYILVNVMEGKDKPYSYAEKSYLMQDGVVVQTMPEQYRHMLSESNSRMPRWEESDCVGSSIDDLDMRMVKRVVEVGVNENRLKAWYGNSPEEYLDYERLRDYEVVKNGAMGMFGKNVVEVLPQFTVCVKKMDNGIAADGNAVDTEFHGNLFELHEKLMNFYGEELSKGIKINTANGQNSREYVLPREVFDEMITNALIHTDYSNFWGRVKLYVYPDRIECTNPGTLSQKMLEGLKKGNHSSAPFNPMMAHVFYTYGLMELSGRGVTLIKQCMKSLGCKAPEWNNVEGNQVRLTIRTIPETPAINQRIKDFIAQHTEGEEFTRVEYQAWFENGLSERTAKYDLKIMVDCGLVDKFGKFKSSRYVLKKN